jgi:hypothetical protein
MSSIEVSAERVSIAARSATDQVLYTAVTVVESVCSHEVYRWTHGEQISHVLKHAKHD